MLVFHSKVKYPSYSNELRITKVTITKTASIVFIVKSISILTLNSHRQVEQVMLKFNRMIIFHKVMA